MSKRTASQPQQPGGALLFSTPYLSLSPRSILTTPYSSIKHSAFACIARSRVCCQNACCPPVQPSAVERWCPQPHSTTHTTTQVAIHCQHTVITPPTSLLALSSLPSLPPGTPLPATSTTTRFCPAVPYPLPPFPGRSQAACMGMCVPLRTRPPCDAGCLAPHPCQQINNPHVSIL